MPISHNKTFRYIYALCEPLTMEVRYVGQTISPADRLYHHVHASRVHNRRKYEWIKDLKERELTPWMIIIENTEPSRADEREFFWINHFRKRGDDLTNPTRPYKVPNLRHLMNEALQT